MTWAEIYIVTLVATPIAATLIAFVVCWRDRHKAGRPASHSSKRLTNSEQTWPVSD